MARVNNGWLEFAGRKSTEFGARLMDPIRYIRPGMRGTAHEAAGLSGDLWQTDNAYDTVDLKRNLRFKLSRLEEVSAWLTGAGLLRFSWAENRAYEARAVKAVSMKQVSVGDDPLIEGNFVFACQPFRRLYPEAGAFTISASNEQFSNPGTAPARPRVKISGSGNFSVTIGMETLFFTGVDGGGIIVDSELMDALTYDGALLANDKMSGTPWQIMPGLNAVLWETGDGGRVDDIEILPRWRYI